MNILADNIVPLFENPRTGDLESQLGNLEYRTQVDAERVTAWMNHLVKERGVEASLKQKSKFDRKWHHAESARSGLCRVPLRQAQTSTRTQKK